MVKKGMFTGVIFLGFGLYFLLQQYNIQIFDDLYSWPTLIIIVGLGFLAQGYLAKDNEAILPGAIITGMGIHFHVVNKLDMWQDHAGVFLLLAAVGILLTYVKTGAGLMMGLLFLAAASLLLFFDRLANWAVERGHDISLISNFWPIFFIAAGAYFIFLQSKK
ncbi:putative integral inner membrane protein [Bacillus freudenreichii]|nr:putative integral inner membrane protein [Bacillus freudenreichii]